MSDTTDKDFFGPEPTTDDHAEVIRVPLPRKDWRLILDALNAAAGEKIAADEALQHPLILSVVKLSSSLIDAGQDRTQAVLLGAAFVTHEEYERVKKQRDYLARWKREELEATSALDLQEVGRLLGLPLGADIYAAIEPGIRKLQEQLAAEKALADRLAGCLDMWRAEGSGSNACYCDAQFAMHGAHPSHDRECVQSIEALAAWKEARNG